MNSSDSSDSCSSDGFDMELAKLKSKAVQTQSKKMQAFLDNAGSLSISQAHEDKAINKEELLACQVISQCLEQGQEVIDLSNLGLQHLPQDIVAPLRHFIKQPNFHPNAYADAACTPLTPSLKLFLGTNQLRSIPASIFDLQYLTVLSLRNNRLEVIPPAIGRLKHLQELNLMGNSLRYLPWEILQLVNGGSSTAAKGPLQKLYVQICPATFSTLGFAQPELPASPGLERSAGFQNISTSSASYFAFDGSPENLTPTQQVLKMASRTPSLFEIALRTSAASPSMLSSISQISESLPQTVQEALERAIVSVEEAGAGGSQCSVCQRNYVTTRAQWFEFARFVESKEYNGPNASETIPFLRRVCSWRCVKDIGDESP